jgi:2-oxoglutarate dehydrogenase complex dehydrogenase (E1) component-like enzyme
MLQPVALSPERRAEIFDRLTWGTQFESFIAQKWTAAKRFGLEGCETLIPGMKVRVHATNTLRNTCSHSAESWYE